MAKSRLTIVVAVALSLCGGVAQAAAGIGWVPPLPGSVVQSEYVAFNGESSENRSRAVVSKKLVSSANGQDFYQWYLSIYAFRRAAYRLRYQSPGNGGPLERIAKAHGARMWFPVQELRIVGAAALMRPGVEQLIVASHEMAADCGSAAVTIFASGPGGSIVPVALVENPCELAAAVIRGANGDAIELRGPYYGPKAPLCCPTNTHASATLRYRDGKWVESPSYFKVE